MEKSLSNHARVAAITALSGAIIMIIGAILYFSSGVDLWASLENQEMAAYLTAVGELRTQLIANLSCWIIGAFLMGTAINTMGTLSTQRSHWVPAARTCAQTAVPLAIIAFIAMMSLIVQIAPDASTTGVALADVVGWIGARADDLATALLVGFAPMFTGLAARKEWMPTWLAIWSYVAGLVGVISLAGLYVPALSGVSFLIVPVGLLWMLAAGVVLLRYSNAITRRP